MLLEEVRRQIVGQCLELEAGGLLQGTAGNASVRVGDLIAITPSGMGYRELAAEDAVVVDRTGEVVDGTRRPSSELDLHLVTYAARPDIGAIVHTHSPFATVLAVLGWPLPAAHYSIAALDTTEVPVVDYETYGTRKLAEAVRGALASGTRAVLLANHGAVTFGADLPKAATATRLLETLAHTYYHARVAGDPVILPTAEVERVRERYRTHGQPRTE
jgi:L-fuculose-phosphate aldolase